MSFAFHHMKYDSNDNVLSLEHHWKKEVIAADIYQPLEFKKVVSPQHSGQ